MSIPGRETENFDLSSVELSLMEGKNSKTIDDIEDLDDGDKILVEVKARVKISPS